jgi:hypothetical protein
LQLQCHTYAPARVSARPRGLQVFALVLAGNGEMEDALAVIARFERLLDARLLVGLTV